MKTASLPKLFLLIAGVLLSAVPGLCDDTIHTKVDENPLPLKTPPPDYPVELRRQGISGLVAVVIVIDEDGKVIEAEVSKSSDPGFEESALAAVRKWRFKPAKVEGAAVKVRVTLPMKFNFSA